MRIFNIFQNLVKSGVLRKLAVAYFIVGVLAGFLFPMVTRSLGISESQGTVYYLATIGAGVFLTIVNILIVNQLLIRKLRPLSDMSSALAGGDLTYRCQYTGNDDIGRISQNMNDMADHLQSTFEEVSSATVQIEEASARLKQVSDETDHCLQTQQSQTEQVATAMNQMTSTFQEVAQHAEQAAEASSTARDQARDGALVATEAMGGLDALVMRVSEAATVVDSLRTDSDNIGVVLDVIRGIAEQTNLLALNAAIEAARAGEQGRGFAVVADEVRTLASKTQQSTQEIQSMIELLQANTISAVDVMTQVKSSAEKSSEQVENGAESLAEIAGAVTTLDTMNTQIASAAEEQRAVAEDINRSVFAISESTEQTAAGTQQTASSSEQLNMLVTRLRSAVANFQ